MIKSRRIRSRRIGWVISLSVLGFVWMVPLIYMVSMSFRTPDNAFEPVLFKAPFTLDNYKLVFSQNPLYQNFLSSMIVTLSSVAMVALGASMAAFGFSRPEVKFKKFLYSALLATLMVPISAMVIPLAQLNSSLGWLNRYQGLIFPYTALGIPFALVILKGFMDSFPRELEDAAIVDGCGNWRLFFRIVLPVLQPGIIVVVVWQFLTSWNEFFLALVVMSETAMKTLTLIPMQYQGFYFSQPGALFAILVIISVPIIVFYMFVSRHFVQGLMSGAIKG